MTTTCLVAPGEVRSAMPYRSNSVQTTVLLRPNPKRAVYLTIALRGSAAERPARPPASVPGTAAARPPPGRWRHGDPAPRPGGELRALLRRAQPHRAQNR